MSSLASQWRAAGVGPGDVLLLHSSAKRTLREHQITPLELLDSFLEALGEHGTLILPTFNFGFCYGKPFNIRETPSKCGILTETARLDPRFMRTPHPVYSFIATGELAPWIVPVDNLSGYGSDSPFAFLNIVGGKIAVLDLPDQNSQTFYHYVEEAHEVPWRYHKAFTGLHTGYAGQVGVADYSVFVRRDGVETHVDPMGDELWRLGLYRGDRPHVGSGLRTIKARVMFDAVAQVIREGKAEGMLWKRSAT